MRDADEPSLDELLMGAARALRRRSATGLGSDLSPHDARALRVIGHHGPTRLGVVADDRRAITVALTAVGEAGLAEVDEARREGAADFFGSLSDRERTSLAALLARLDPREP